VTGDLTVKDITAPVTFAVSAVLTDGGMDRIGRDDRVELETYGLEIPSVPRWPTWPTRCC
jgi:polyisoprenoid-binding protein YceI